MIETTWDEMPEHYPGVASDVRVVMPNHLHGIVVLSGRETDEQIEAGRADTGGSAPTRELWRKEMATGGEESAQPPIALPELMRRFKSLTTMRYGIGVRQEGWPRYEGLLWQRSYHERVIRNERELQAVRAYVLQNPLQWKLDRENPFSGRAGR
jgi:REP element-mobilizing transposase RayT